MGAGVTPRDERVVARVAVAWNRILCIGLNPDARARRVAELQTDLWDQAHDPDPARAAAALGRVVRGVPADLVWRWHAAGPRSSVRWGRLAVLLSFAVAFVPVTVGGGFIRVMPALVAVTLTVAPRRRETNRSC